MKKVLLIFIGVKIFGTIYFVSKTFGKKIVYHPCEYIHINNQDMAIEIGRTLLSLHFQNQKNEFEAYSNYSAQDVGSFGLLVTAHRPRNSDYKTQFLGGNPSILFNRYTLKVYEIYWSK